MQRSQFIAGAAGVMALILIMVGVYLYNHMPRGEPVTVPVVLKPLPQPSPTALLLPPPVFTKPVPRAVISNYKFKPAQVKFSGIADTFTGTWAAYPQLCESAWYRITEKQISVAGAGQCHVRGLQTAARAVSQTIVLDCHHNDYNGQETWNITQPREGALNIRKLTSEGSTNGVSLYRCNQTVAQN